MPLDTHIPDMATYVAGMEKSLIDKIYFMDKVEADVFVDFGCADGLLLRTLKKLFPDHHYFGFDLSSEMVEQARSHPDSEGIEFDTSWEKVVADAKKLNGKTCLILSSVIHEIYAYSNPEEIEEFWRKVWNSGFDYIAIRDMAVSNSTNRQADPIASIRVRQLFDPKHLQEWENTWGSINENWSLTHFFLTYRYTENWTREVKENYLPISLETLVTMIPPKYFPEHIEHYTLPFLRRVVMCDFGVQLQDRTHIKLILGLSYDKN